MKTQNILPDSALSQHIAVLGKTGSGKTSTSKLLIEQVTAAGARVCVLDPIKSDWWGLTSTADGTKAGLPFQILGGPRGHVPLHAGAGKAIGELVANGALPLSILDMADFAPGGLSQFFNEFAPVLLRKMRGVLYLVIEEAHEFAPKERSGIGAETVAIHWAKKLATAGRSKGIRMILATQRTQSLHNALLGSCDTLIAHRFTAPADQEPILKWLKGNVEPATAREVEASISSLKTGEGWICSGEAQIFERRQFPRIQTFDNSKTPTDDDADVQVVTATVDTNQLRQIVGEAVADAEANDPKALKARIAELEKQQSGHPRMDRDALQAAHNRGKDEGWGLAMQSLSGILPNIQTFISAGRKLQDQIESIPLDPPKTEPLSTMARHEQPRPAIDKHFDQFANLGKSENSPRKETDLPRPQQRILDALAWLGSIKEGPADRVQIAFLADQSPKSSGYSNNLSALRTADLIFYPGGGTIALTNAGHKAANKPSKTPSNFELHHAIEKRVSGPQWRILQALMTSYPACLTREALAKQADQSAASSGYSNNLSALRTLGLLDYSGPGKIVGESILFLGN